MRFRRLAFGLARSSVRSDTGAEVRVGIPYLTYSEGDYVLKVGRELAFRAPDPTDWLIALKARERYLNPILPPASEAASFKTRLSTLTGKKNLDPQGIQRRFSAVFIIAMNVLQHSNFLGIDYWRTTT